MNGLKSSLESASTLTNYHSIIEGLGDSFDETLASGVRIRYGYPFATQTNLKLLLDLSEYGWNFTRSTSAIPFTLRDTDNMSVSEISNNSVCKLIYTRANKGERPAITISDCTI